MSYTPMSRRAFGAHLLRLSVAGMALVAAVPVAAQENAHRQPAPVRPANAVVHWNAIASEAFTPSQGTNPMAQSRTYAILHAAIHDALNAIQRRYEAYTPGIPAAPNAAPEAAVAAAAREVLTTLVPQQAALVEAKYTQALQAVPDGASEDSGVALGLAAARATLQRRHDDAAASAAEPPYLPRSGAGEYQFTPPFDFAAAPGWGRVRPFAVDLSAHRLRGPYALTSVQYARDFAYVRDIGRIDSTTRTPEQTQIAKFWYEDSPLGWNRIANGVVRNRGVDEWEAARAFALVNFAMADGFVAGFEAKYEFRFWRPLTAIHAAGNDGNALTDADPTWQPYMDTPPVPDYPSTHTVLGWAAAEVLIGLFGDQEPHAVTSLTLPGVTRHYRGFSRAAEENGQSRIYAGIHFPYAVSEGRRQGRQIGKAVSAALPRVRGTRLSDAPGHRGAGKVVGTY